jgi:hypothetical protein
VDSESHYFLSSDLFFPPNANDANSLQPAHCFLKSIHNIVIEKGWWRFRMLWGDNIVAFYEAGITNGIYNIDVPGH